MQTKLFQKTGNRELLTLWPELERKIPEYFKNCDIYPCLLHGDLWSGNYSFTKDGPGWACLMDSPFALLLI